MDHLRYVSRADDILKIILEAFQQKVQVVLWQKGRVERRLMLAEMKFIDQDEKTLFIKSTNGSAFYFDETLPVQVKTDFKGLSFRSSIQMMKESLIVLKWPETIYLEDAREKERNRIGLYGEHVLGLEKNASHEKPIRQWDLRILDISLLGASVLISKENLNDFDEGDQINIYSVSTFILPEKMQSTIVYLLPHEHSADSSSAPSEQSFRMGLKFQHPLSKALMLLLQSDFPHQNS